MFWTFNEAEYPMLYHFMQKQAIISLKTNEGPHPILRVISRLVVQVIGNLLSMG
jgi:hypothetical protein